MARYAAAALFFLACGASAAWAQVEDRQFLEEQKRQELEDQERKKILEEEYKQDFIFDYGAWLRTEIIYFDDQRFKLLGPARTLRRRTAEG